MCLFIHYLSCVACLIHEFESGVGWDHHVYGVTLLVGPFNLAAGGNLYQFSKKPIDNWPLIRYVKLRVAHAPRMPGTLPTTAGLRSRHASRHVRDGVGGWGGHQGTYECYKMPSPKFYAMFVRRSTQRPRGHQLRMTTPKEDRDLLCKFKHAHWQFMGVLVKGYVSVVSTTMMTSSNGNIFRITGHLCGEFTGLRWIPRTKASDAELCCFIWSASE